LARGLGSGSKPLLKDKKGLGLLVNPQGITLHYAATLGAREIQQRASGFSKEVEDKRHFLGGKRLFSIVFDRKIWIKNLKKV
jgi:hypothetical protein